MEMVKGFFMLIGIIVICAVIKMIIDNIKEF